MPSQLRFYRPPPLWYVFYKKPALKNGDNSPEIIRGEIIFQQNCVGFYSKIACNITKDRSSRCQIFFKLGILKNFAIFTRKHLRWSLFLIKLQAFTLTQVFSCQYCEMFKNSFSYRTSTVAAFVKISQVNLQPYLK